MRITLPLFVVALALSAFSARAGMAPDTGTLAPRAAPAFAALAVRPAPPAITSIAPDTLTPGGEAVLTGTGFGATPAANVVTVDGVRVRVTAASPTELTVEMPVGGFACRPPRAAAVSVRAGGATGAAQHPLRAATPIDLAPGEVATPRDTGPTHCLELAQTGGTYIVGVVNALPDEVDRGFVLNGALGAEAGPPVSAMARDTGLIVPPSQAELPEAAIETVDSLRRGAQEHMEQLERDRELVEELGPAPRDNGAAPAAMLASPPAPPEIGTLATLRVRTSLRECASSADVVARVVDVGEHSIVYEDVASPLAGTMDGELRALRREFDEKMWGIVEETFGNPLAMDRVLDGDGRVRMLFTPKVSSLRRDYLGFVTPCDFYPPSQANASSNHGEFFYAAVPGPGNKQEWLRIIRPTLVHELKHIVSYAERLSRSAPVEQPWLEEATAMVAAELYARTFSSAGQRGNVKYASALRCEIEYDAADPRCGDWPRSMSQHFGWLNYYLFNNEQESVFTQGYGGGWSLVRWAADLSQDTEPEFFAALVQNRSAIGAANLSGVLGREFPDLIVDWLIASAVDDYYDGFHPATTEHSLQGWDMRDIYRHLHDARVEGYQWREYPLAPREKQFGAFRFRVNNLRSATASFLRLHGTQVATQMLWINDGTRPLPDDTGLRLAVARIW